MTTAINQGDSIKTVFVYQKDEQVEEAELNLVQLTALLKAKQVWIEKFGNSLRIENTVWSYTENSVALQIYVK